MRVNKLSRSVLNVIFFDSISKVFTLIVTILIIRGLSTEEYAVFTLFNSIALFLYGIFGSGLSLAFVRYYAEQKSRNSNKTEGLYFFNILLTLSIYLLIFSLTPFVVAILNLDVFIWVASVVFSVSLTLNQVNQAYYQAREMYSKSGIISNTKSLLLSIYLVLVFLVFRFESLNSVLIGYITSAFLGFFVGNYFIVKRGEKFPQKGLTNYTSMVKDSIWLIFYVFILNLFNQVDIFMINGYLQSIDVSNYGVAFKYYSLSLTLLSAIQIVLRVQTSSKTLVDNVEAQKLFTNNWIKRSTPISLLITIIAIVLSRQVFPFINGPQYNSSIITFNILMIGAGLSYITAPNMGVMMASGRHKLLCLIALGALIINYIGNLLFIPVYGINAAAITTVVSQFFLNGVVTLSILLRKT